ncbi:iron chaperone [Streptomyces sp. NPDC057686]|uniref:iron chaperone n=1 Tax=Streptomyces sp. NPDC057686 TaxID=3346212 RepID=UPI00369EF90E
MPAADDVDAYLAGVPEARREALTGLRELCLAELTGFEEVMAHGMPAYARAGAQAGEIAWANQKQYISFYLLRTDVRDAFADRLAGHDTGKACLRFRRPSAVDFTLLRDLLRATASAAPGPVCT